MPSIDMHQFFARNAQLEHYPKVSIDSIPSKFLLFISSTSNIFGKCLFLFIIFLTNLVYFRYFLYNSLDSVFKFQLRSFFSCLFSNWTMILFYSKYNYNLLRQINNHWNGLQIDFDHETRKYFWTQKAIYRWLFYALFIISIIFDHFHELYVWNNQESSKSSSESIFKQNVIFYFSLIIREPFYLDLFCMNCIYIDLPVLAQTTVQFNLIKVKKLLDEAKKDEKSLHINDIQNFRYKYLLSCRLVDKINEIMSPCLFITFAHFVVDACKLSYFLLFTEQKLFTKWYQVIHCGFVLINILLSTHAAVRIHEKSKELLSTVYKLSFKTNSIRLLNEITLFLNHNEVGLSFGGIFMLTTSSLSTLFSILTTIVLAIPTFAR